MLNIKVVTWALALFFTVSFILCIIYGLIIPENLQMYRFLETVLPGFKGLTFVGFFIGLIESFLWGAYIGLVFVPIYNFCYKKWANPSGK